MGPSFVSNTRVTIFAATVAVLFSVITARLFYLHVVNQDQARQIIAESRYRFQKIKPRRGVILDRDGNVLASSKPVWDIGVDPMMVDIRDREKLGYLAMILNQDESLLVEKFGWSPDLRNHKSRSRWVKLAESVDESVYKAVNRLEVKGVYGNRYFSRYYPAEKDAAHVVGFINKAETPVMGIERTLDFYLEGSPGWRIREINGSRKEIRHFRVREVDARNGYHVELTLDSGIQQFVEDELDWIYENLQPQSASIIVSECKSGAVLAMGSRPHFDPNEFWDYDLDRDFRNRAISDVYEPGSTFKIITAAGFMNDRLGDRSTKFDCATRSVYHRNRRVVLPTDTRQRGVLEFHEIIKKSSNRGTALAGFKLGENRFFDYCQAFGFGEKTGIELSGEETGILHPLDKWDHYTLSRVTIGYGVGVTPIQMHTAMSVVANDGHWYAPHVVSRVMDDEFSPVVKFEIPEPKRVISKNTARDIRDCLVEAVSLSGTGSKATLRNIQIAGKTGTSRVLLDDGYSEERHVGSFSGFFPAEQPEYIITVVVNDPQQTVSTYGGSVAAPSFKNIAEYIVSTKGISPVRSGKELLTFNE